MQSGELCTDSTSCVNMAVMLSPQDISVDYVSNSKLLRMHLKRCKDQPLPRGCRYVHCKDNRQLVSSISNFDIAEN